MLSARASAIWIGALCAVLLFHCVHVVRMRGERRWYHCAHVLMLIGMVYMFAPAAFGVEWAPAAAWIVVYAVSSATIAFWILARRRMRRSSGGLWLLAFAQQCAMVYMWLPMSDWIPWLSYALGAYFTLEMIAWLAKSSVELAPAGAAAVPDMALAPRSIVNDLCMTIMAGSMGYMLVGMQLTMSAQSQLSASTPGEDETVAGGPRSAGSRAAASDVPTTYIIVGGDTLGGIARRFYGNESEWRKIAAFNPRLEPRRLPVGGEIRLPPRRGFR